MTFQKGNKVNVGRERPDMIGNGFSAGKIPWNKGITGYSTLHRGTKLSDEQKKKMSIAHIGIRMPQHVKENLRKINTGNKYNLGRKLTAEQRISLSKKLPKKENHYNWKGGITKEHKMIRTSLEYKLWRESVFLRDDWTCVFCKVKGGTLNADHIKPFAYYPELRFAIDNGRTLCVPCHKTTDTYAAKARYL